MAPGRVLPLLACPRTYDTQERMGAAIATPAPDVIRIAAETPLEACSGRARVIPRAPPIPGPLAQIIHPGVPTPSGDDGPGSLTSRRLGERHPVRALIETPLPGARRLRPRPVLTP